ncbi:MAG TPA: magnesium transporter [Rhodospirillaceae bacterium]|nr:magnesium transporter [Rhodospirillaceae bacterium]
MLTLYCWKQKTCVKIPFDAIDPMAPTPEGTFWIDLINPTIDEESAVERILGIKVPSRAEMSEIEASSRLYVEDQALVMTLPVIHKSTSDEPETTAVTFVLANDRLVTLRYADPAPFVLFTQRLQRSPALAHTGEHVLLALLEQITDRLADILEASMASLDAFSRETFRAEDAAAPRLTDHRDALRRIGRVGTLGAKAKESLLNLSRLLLFLTAHSDINESELARVKTLMRDAKSIDEHASFLSSKVSFLLDATMSLVNIEQNNIIKIFSVAAVIVMPPTLVASIYGMNFKFMPELQFGWGYPFALFLMFISAVIPFWWFRRKKWL